MDTPERITSSPDRSTEGPQVIQVVEFVLGTGRFAIDLFDVKEVVEHTSITRLPSAPSFVTTRETVKVL